MRVFRCYFMVLMMCAALMKGQPSLADIRDLPTLNVLAPPALAEMIARSTRAYAQRQEMTLNLVILPEKDVLDYLQRGESADVLLTMEPETLTQLRYQGMLDFSSIRTLAKHPVLLVSGTPFTLQDSQIDPQEAQQLPAALKPHALLRQRLRMRPLYIGHPQHSMSGVRALQWMRHLQLSSHWRDEEAIGPSQHQPMIALKTGRDALQMIRGQRGQALALAADVYALQTQPATLFIWGSLPLKTEDIPLVQGAVVAGDHMEPARAFLQYLASQEARSDWRDFGLLPESTAK